jgi:hypothetical protein
MINASRHGYIPLDIEDKKFRDEQVQECSQGFTPCTCSNCMPKEADALINIIQQMNTVNFESIMKNPLSLEKDPSIVTLTQPQKTKTKKATCSFPATLASHLHGHLIAQFNEFHAQVMMKSCECAPEVFFSSQHATAIVDNIDAIISSDPHNKKLPEKVIGGQFINGQVDC